MGGEPIPPEDRPALYALVPAFAPVLPLRYLVYELRYPVPGGWRLGPGTHPDTFYVGKTSPAFPDESAARTSRCLNSRVWLRQPEKQETSSDRNRLLRHVREAAAGRIGSYKSRVLRQLARNNRSVIESA